MDLIKIIQCYNSKQQKFKFEDHEPRGITSEDVAQIFGLNNQGVELPNTDKSTKNIKDNFVNTYFADQKITINKSKKKKRKNGEESTTTSGCTSLILYWICLHTNLVEIISGRENMVPAIERWDITKIHKAIRDIPVEQIVIGGSIPCVEPSK
ncbi:hypothetical protein DVH24_004695 [Malus domestica]|uniref:Aminotransferase-like plant mobile domain-containing protein n=1 Tax=Malus domestica TaxID=3750 RepID=A0A498IGZ0_MALDO|nr:hypothetical protein DVH24_004695 [Malus domestica]